MASLMTFADLRGLARLYRDGIDGAKQEISRVIRNDVESLPGIVGFPAENVTRLTEAEDPVDLLVITIEAAARRARDDRSSAQKRLAHQLAAALSPTATDRDATVTLSPRALLDIVCAWPGRGMLGFGDRGGVGIPGLRAFLRACRSVDELDATLTADTLVLRYATSVSRGAVRLHLHSLSGEEVVVVPLLVRQAQVEVAPSVTTRPAAQLTPGVSRARPAIPLHTRTAPDVRPATSFVHRFLDAMTAAIGAAP